MFWQKYSNVPRRKFPGGGGTGLEKGMGMCHGRDSLAYQFITNAPLRCPLFATLEKIAFSALFLAKMLALKTQNIRIFAPKTLIFQGKPAP